MRAKFFSFPWNATRGVVYGEGVGWGVGPFRVSSQCFALEGMAVRGGGGSQGVGVGWKAACATI